MDSVLGMLIFCAGGFAGATFQLPACGVKGLPPFTLPQSTQIGALASYASGYQGPDFQPMGANFGILPELAVRPRDKAERGQAYADRALEDLRRFIEENRI